MNKQSFFRHIPKSLSEAEQATDVAEKLMLVEKWIMD